MKCQDPSLNMAYPNSVNGSDTKYRVYKKLVATIQIPVLQSGFQTIVSWQ